MRIHFISILRLALLATITKQQGFEQTASEMNQNVMIPKYDDPLTRIPSQNYNPPNQAYMSPPQSFSPPLQGYNPQSQENLIPHNYDYMSSNPNPVAPNQNSPSPNQNYMHPIQNYSSQDQNYLQQNSNNEQSENKYVQSNQAAFLAPTNNRPHTFSKPRKNKQQTRKRRNSRISQNKSVLEHPSRQAYLNTSFGDYTPPLNKTYTPDPINPDSYTNQAVAERNGPVDYYPHPSFFNRFENWQGFNNWFKDLWRTGRFTHEYRYDLIDTNFFVGQPETVGNPIYSDQESVDLQNYEQHFAHLQKILADERTDQDFVMAYSKERASHERMLRFRQMRNTVFQSILKMEQIIYAEQEKIIIDLKTGNEKFENDTMANITAALTNISGKPFYPKFADPLDIFAS